MTDYDHSASLLLSSRRSGDGGSLVSLHINPLTSTSHKCMLLEARVAPSPARVARVRARIAAADKAVLPGHQTLLRSRWRSALVDAIDDAIANDRCHPDFWLSERRVRRINPTSHLGSFLNPDAVPVSEIVYRMREWVYECGFDLAREADALAALVERHERALTRDEMFATCDETEARWRNCEQRYSDDISEIVQRFAGKRKREMRQRAAKMFRNAWRLEEPCSSQLLEFLLEEALRRRGVARVDAVGWIIRRE